MTDISYEAYLWLKALHIIAFVAWMAGLLYLPRLYVYHAGVPTGSERDQLLQVMEYRLLKYIMNPAMIVTFALGIWLLVAGGHLAHGWMHAKLLLVLVLAGLHGAMAVWRKGFAIGSNQHSARFYRIMNELPTLCLIGIVILVIIKPF